jgi:hypothetical protein
MVYLDIFLTIDTIRTSISSFFSELNFSSLRRRWFISRKTSSMSVHGLAILDAKIRIFHETAKSKETTFNTDFSFCRNAKSFLASDKKLIDEVNSLMLLVTPYSPDWI